MIYKQFKNVASMQVNGISFIFEEVFLTALVHCRHDQKGNRRFLFVSSLKVDRFTFSVCPKTVFHLFVCRAAEQ